ncbi:MAG: hypothetical protein J6V82_04940, partial [Clostridia bacterium]|nr:hypothetical protein [Clostridia bacterium]
SKIQSAEDLASIGTLGFRGEALAAIASVSNLTILTKTKDAAAGTMLVSEAGVVKDLCEVGCADGTTVVVEHLFANVPARRKFLKKDRTEAMAVTALVEKIALSRPDIAIRYVCDGETKLVTAGDGEVLHVLYAIEGREYAMGMLSVSNAHAGISVRGYVGNPDQSKSNRTFQTVYINGRYVRSKTVSAAAEKAYTSYIAPDKFPAFCLFLECDLSAVDVNVHPAKMEVRFSDERPVFEAVYYAIRTALEKSTLRPSLSVQSNREMEAKRLVGAFAPATGSTKTEQIAFAERIIAAAKAEHAKPVTPPAYSAPSPARQMPASPAFVRSGESVFASPSRPLERTPEPVPTPAVPPLPKEDEVAVAEKEAPAFVPWEILGVAYDCYIIARDSEGLLLIDQHAAHERILFEKMKNTVEKEGKIAAQSLLVPLSFSLSALAADAAEEAKADFETIGYAFSLSGRTVSLHAIPMALDPASAQSFFESTAAKIAQDGENPTISDQKRREQTLYQLACKAAIKGGRNYDEAHLRWLCDALAQMPDVTVCPHGRPIACR